MATKRCYIDTSVLIAAFRGKDAISASAMEVLDDPDRDILVSRFSAAGSPPQADLSGKP